jgi:hypothetical protein
VQLALEHRVAAAEVGVLPQAVEHQVAAPALHERGGRVEERHAVRGRRLHDPRPRDEPGAGLELGRHAEHGVARAEAPPVAHERTLELRPGARRRAACVARRAPDELPARRVHAAEGIAPVDAEHAVGLAAGVARRDDRARGATSRPTSRCTRTMLYSGWRVPHGAPAGAGKFGSSSALSTATSVPATLPASFTAAVGCTMRRV